MAITARHKPRPARKLADIDFGGDIDAKLHEVEKKTRMRVYRTPTKAMVKKCENCGVTFSTVYHRIRTCGRSCAALLRNKHRRITVPCHTCGKDTQTSIGYSKKCNVYCSKECSAIGREKGYCILPDERGTHKVCPQCHENKPLSEFYSIGINKFGVHIYSWCKACHLAKSKSRPKNPQVQKDKLLRQAAERNEYVARLLSGRETALTEEFGRCLYHGNVQLEVKYDSRVYANGTKKISWRCSVCHRPALRGRDRPSKGSKRNLNPITGLLPRDMTCPACGKVFVQTRPDMRTCGKECAIKMRRAGHEPVTRKCEMCGNEFTSNPGRHQKCCSLQCAARIRADRLILKPSDIPAYRQCKCCKQTLSIDEFFTK